MSASSAADIYSVPKGMEVLCVSAHSIAWSLAAGPAGIVGMVWGGGRRVCGPFPFDGEQQ